MKHFSKQRLVEKRELLIRDNLIPHGVTSPRVLDVFRQIPREEFVPEALRDRAYENSPLSIGFGQTISQPLMIGLMLQALDVQPEDKVLEVGTGSGYQAALLSLLGRDVVSVERLRELAEESRLRLHRLKYTNVKVYEGDGSKGWLEEAPFNRIIVACGAPKIPESLPRQLSDGGRLVIPAGSRSEQTLTILDYINKNIHIDYRGGCVFVPLIGEEGWAESGEKTH